MIYSDWLLHSWWFWVAVVWGGKWTALVMEEAVLAAETLSVRPCTLPLTVCTLHTYNMHTVAANAMVMSSSHY